MDNNKSGCLVQCDAFSRSNYSAIPTVGCEAAQKKLSKNVENTAQLEAKPEYLCQLRAIGVGIVAAAGTTLLLQSDENDTENSVGSEESTQSSD